MIRRPPRSTQGGSSAASDVYKRQVLGRGGSRDGLAGELEGVGRVERADPGHDTGAVAELGLSVGDTAWASIKASEITVYAD